MLNKIFIMKKLTIFLSFIGLLFVSCQKDDIELSTISDVTWYSSTPLSANINLATAGVAISIIDLSQNALTHEWTISNNASFLKPGFTNKLGTNLAPFIDETKGKSTTDQTLFVYFPTAGDYTIKMRHTFKDQVTYKGVVPLQSVLIDGVWVFEHTFNVKVN